MSFRRAVVDFGVLLTSLVSIDAAVQVPEGSLGGDFPIIRGGQQYDTKVEVRFLCVRGSTKALEIAKAVESIKDERGSCFLRFSFKENSISAGITYCGADDNGHETEGCMTVFECHSFGYKNGDVLPGSFAVFFAQLTRMGCQPE